MRNMAEKQQRFQNLADWVLKHTLIQSGCCIVLSLWPYDSCNHNIYDHCLIIASNKPAQDI